MPTALLRLIEVLGVGAAAAPLLRLEWWSALVTLPALAVAYAADRAQRVRRDARAVAGADR